MKLLWLYLAAFLFLPIAGEFVLLISDETISAGNTSVNLIIHNSIFAVTILFIAFIVQNYKAKSVHLNMVFTYTDAKEIFNKAIIILTISSIIVFIFSGYYILMGVADRGLIRISLGIFGPLYTFVLSYLPIAIFIYCSVIYAHLKPSNQKILKKKLILLYTFAFILGIFSGYKAVAVMLLVPGFTILFFNKLSFLKLLIFIGITILLLTLFTSFVRGGIDIDDAFFFLIHRATVMTAYGTIGVWNHFSEGVPFTDIFINFLGAFGEKISSFLLGISPHDPEFLKTNLSRLVTYAVYPDTERALEGSVNVTVTDFGHAVYLFGKNLYIYYAVIMGVIIGLFIRAFKLYVMKGYPLKASLTGLYFFTVIIPSINSGGIFMLFSLPALVYFAATYLILAFILQKRILLD